MRREKGGGGEWVGVGGGGIWENLYTDTCNIHTWTPPKW